MTSGAGGVDPSWCMRDCGCTLERGHDGKCDLTGPLPKPGCRCDQCLADAAGVEVAGEISRLRAENERLTLLDGDVHCEHPTLDASQPGGYCGPCGNEMDRHSRTALAAALTAAEQRADTLAGMGPELAVLSRWVDDANAHRDREAQLWGRVAKVSEECGEAIAALVGATGQNPRKGVHGCVGDVVDELLDVAVTALAAVEHIDGNVGGSVQMLADHLSGLLERAGLAALSSRPVQPEGNRT